MGRAWAFKGGGKRGGGGGRNNQQSATNCIDIVLKWVTSENGTIHTHHPHPSTGSLVFLIFLTSRSNSRTTSHRGGEGGASFIFPLKSAKYLN